MSTEFIFTAENLIENKDKLGPWSSYGLASKALQHYFPEEYKDGCITVNKEAKLLHKLGCEYWADAVVKYHKEIGYDSETDFDPAYVNEF